jgi:uncharacterized protein with PIN domain
MARLVVVFTSASFTEAHSIRCLLEGNGLGAVVLDDHLIAQNPGYGGPLGFIKVAVPDDETSRVKNIFKEVLGETGELPLAGKSFHPYTDILRVGQPAAEDTPAELVCSKCGAKCAPDSEFCDQCGAPLTKPSPQEPEPAPEAQTCPNCQAVLEPHKNECPGCKFELRLMPKKAPPHVAVHSPKARYRCSKCGSIYTKSHPACPECKAELVALKRDDRLCPGLRHVVERTTGDSALICRGCKAVWLGFLV